MRFNRRTMLRGTAGAAAALPWLEMLSGKVAHAQTTPPKRFLVFFTPQGFVMDAWRPSASGADFQLPEILAPLAPFQDRLNILSGIDNDVNYVNRLSNGHNAAARTLLTCMPFAQNMDAGGGVRPESQQVSNGFAAGPSIDQVLARRISTSTRLRSLDLGIGGQQVGETQLLHAGPDDPITLLGDPQVVFDRLFADLETGSTMPPTPSTPQERLQARRSLILDRVQQSFGLVRARAGAEDRRRLDAHADKIRELQQRFSVAPGPVTAACAQPNLQSPGGYDAGSASWDYVSGPNMVDLMVMALRCDMTRVGTLQYVHYHENTFPWLGQGVPGRWSNWHSMIHEARDSGGRELMIRAMRWYAEQFAYLLAEMDAVDEGQGTLLDNSLVMWISDFGDGSAHQTNDLPIVLAGGLGGTLPTGRHLTFGRHRTGDLYTTLLNLFGGTDSCFGLSDYCSGPLPGLV